MTNFSLEVVMDGVLDITDDLDVYVEEDNNNNAVIVQKFSYVGGV